MHVVDADIAVFLMILAVAPRVMFVVGLVPLEPQSFVLPWFIVMMMTIVDGVCLLNLLTIRLDYQCYPGCSRRDDV